MADSTRPTAVIAVALFDYVQEEARDLRAKKVKLADELRSDDRIVLFLENFIAQFSANVLGTRIQGLNPKTLEEWVAQRRRLEDQPSTEAAQRLMFVLERTFTLVAEMVYGTSEADVASFRREYVPEVLVVCLANGYVVCDTIRHERAGCPVVNHCN